jgi:hypothetical protein
MTRSWREEYGCELVLPVSHGACASSHRLPIILLLLVSILFLMLTASRLGPVYGNNIRMRDSPKPSVLSTSHNDTVLVHQGTKPPWSKEMEEDTVNTLSRASRVIRVLREVSVTRRWG